MTGDEILSLMRLGIFDRDKPADREIMLNLLDQPKEMPMTWNGVPEHRNLGDGDEPREPLNALRDILGTSARPAPVSPAGFFREQAERLGRKPSAWACAKCGGSVRRAIQEHSGGDAREACAACSWPSGTPYEPPADDASLMPADPFGGVDEGAIATVEMFRAHMAAGLTEQQALFYCACLVHVGHVIQQGGLIPPPEER